MDIFTQKKILVRALIVLIVVNLLSISAFLWKEIFRKPPPPKHTEKNKDDVSSILEEKLNLTDSQVKQVRELRNKCQEKEKSLGEIIVSERDSMNVEMFRDSSDEKLVKAIAARIADNEYQMEMLRYDQAKQLKTICNAEQLSKFEELVIEIRDYFRPDSPQNRKKEDKDKDPPKP